MKKSNIYKLAMMSLMMSAGFEEPFGMSGTSMKNDGSSRNENQTKKCFREGCEKRRNGNRLYCSADCCKLDKKK